MVSSANFKSLTEWSLGVQSFVYREKSQNSTFSKVWNFRGRDLGAEYVDWLSSCRIAFQPPYLHSKKYIYYCYCVMKCSFKSISSQKLVV